MNDLFSLAGKNILITGAAQELVIYWRPVLVAMARALLLTISPRSAPKQP